MPSNPNASNQSAGRASCGGYRKGNAGAVGIDPASGSTVIFNRFFECRVTDFKNMTVQTTVNGKIRQKGSYT
jgi:hypothetical protein